MTITFRELGLSDACSQQLENIGFVEPTQIQQEAIPALLQGRDIFGQSQTGTGKTAAFSLPALELIDPSDKSVQVLILTPTRELAQQVGDAIKDFIGNRRIFVLNVYGGQAIDRQIRSLQRGVHVVVGTPGRVIDLLERRKLNLGNLSNHA